ncbi:LacI family DNA-binding transcriptional regulator [Nonomuraea sp. NEAU-A123]|uniref:LacI family DNA-binding transcriptional regulator n=1 Tax=Nonomuraea sp. NEAU-A123 TaxID=2839649 RepID=UPI001BE495B8|nr:LacI family DNA-binding transcriptional regulator [Nonomuraea sp. NEAU-A123]MBT2233300.1 LacI family transcriptional regulator [Nonomuraea sp. NEAU-A123]
MSAGRPTIIDVARDAGVSPATAGRVLGGYGTPAPELVHRVQASAKRLGYRPNDVARSIVTGSTRVVGVVVSDLENPFFARAVSGISDRARDAGYEMLLISTGMDVERERSAVEALMVKRVDGMIVASASVSEGTHLRRVREAGVPLVLLDRRNDGAGAVDAVLLDNRAAAHRAVSHVLDEGHRAIAVVTPSVTVERPAGRRRKAMAEFPSSLRFKGYLDALEEAGVTCDPGWVLSCDDADAAGERVRELLATRRDVTAIFATTNVMTRGAFGAIIDSDRRCPEDVSLLGFDDHEWSTLVRPRLSVVAQPAYDLGSAAGTVLLGRLSGRESPSAPSETILRSSLIVRGSVAAPPS